MDQGLAHQMTYGTGEGQSTKHHYAGVKKALKKKKTAKKVRK
jgi:hypothetical protein